MPSGRLLSPGVTPRDTAQLRSEDLCVVKCFVRDHPFVVNPDKFKTISCFLLFQIQSKAMT